TKARRYTRSRIQICPDLQPRAEGRLRSEPRVAKGKLDVRHVQVLLGQRLLPNRQHLHERSLSWLGVVYTRSGFNAGSVWPDAMRLMRNKSFFHVITMRAPASIAQALLILYILSSHSAIQQDCCAIGLN